MHKTHDGQHKQTCHGVQHTAEFEHDKMERRYDDGHEHKHDKDHHDMRDHEKAIHILSTVAILKAINIQFRPMNVMSMTNINTIRSKSTITKNTAGNIIKQPIIKSAVPCITAGRVTSGLAAANHLTPH